MSVRFAPLLLLAMTVACNALVGWGDLQEVNGDPVTSAPDGGPTSAHADGGPTTPPAEAGSVASDSGEGRCDPTKDFGQPVLLGAAINTSAAESDVTLTADELAAFFQRSTSAGVSNIVESQRQPSGDWGAASPLTNLSAAPILGNPAVSADGLVLFWAEQQSTSAALEVHWSRRAAASATFPEGDAFAPAASGADDFSPFVSADGTEVYWVSSRDGGFRHIFRATGSLTSATYSAASEIAELEFSGVSDLGDPAQEAGIALTSDGLTAYFASDRSDGVGGYDLWQAHRAAKTTAFADISIVANVNSSLTEYPNWVSRDGCLLYLTRFVTANDSEIMVATRGP